MAMTNFDDVRRTIGGFVTGSAGNLTRLDDQKVIDLLVRRVQQLTVALDESSVIGLCSECGTVFAPLPVVGAHVSAYAGVMSFAGRYVCARCALPVFEAEREENPELINGIVIDVSSAVCRFDWAALSYAPRSAFATAWRRDRDGFLSIAEVAERAAEIKRLQRAAELPIVEAIRAYNQKHKTVEA